MSNDHLLKHEHLSKNTFWNILSQILPALAAIYAIPKLIHGMGNERFGLLTICWMISGYFSLLDFGIGRALTQKIAGSVIQSETQKISILIKNALLSTALISFCLMGALLAISNVLIINVLHTPQDLLRETQITFLILAISLPLMIGSASLRGILESLQRFDLINSVKVPTSTLSFLVPLLTLQFSNELHWILSSLLFFRAVTFFFYWIFCARLYPEIKIWSSYKDSMNGAHVRSLLKTGGWMTISNILGPIMFQMDRFFIGHILTISVVAYYTTPYEMISKIWIITGAIVGVLFPALATSLATQSKTETQALLGKGTKSIVVLVLPTVFFFILFAQEGLQLWLGAEMANQTVRVTQILAVGFFVNSLANVPFALIQAYGRADITAKIHTFEIFVYIPLIIFLIKTYGVEGAAFAWSLRALLDLLLLSYFEQKLLGANKYIKTVSTILLPTAVCILTVYLSDVFNIYAKLGVGLAVCICVGLWILKLSKLNQIFLLRRG